MKIAKTVATVIFLVSLLYIMWLQLEGLRLDSYSLGVSDGAQAGYDLGYEEGHEQGLKVGIEIGQKSGRSDLGLELIMACIPESQDSACTMEFESVEGHPSTISIGDKRLFCLQGDSPIAC